MVLEISLFFSPPRTQAIPLAPGLGQRVELQVPGATRVLAGKCDASRPAPHSSDPLERGVQEEKGMQGSGRRRSCSHAWPVQLFLTGKEPPFWVSAPRTPLLHLPLLWMQNISGPGASCTAWPVKLPGEHRPGCWWL